jgi:NADH-quinone oxidoreductase subunit N
MDKWIAFIPFALPVFWGLLVLLLGVFLAPKQRYILSHLSLVGVALVSLSAIMAYKALAPNSEILAGYLVLDTYFLFFALLLTVATFITVLSATYYLEREGLVKAEFLALLFFCLSGMLLLTASRDLITLFVALEIVSMSVYVLVGYDRENIKANEGAFKYFLLGSMASALLLYGIALLYGSVASTRLYTIHHYFSTHVHEPLAAMGLLLVLVGLAFKVAAVPFHTWSPDAYEGASIPVTGFMATAVKAAIFALLIRVLAEGFISLKTYWIEVLAVLSVLTMLTGNILAFTQRNIKRMLAYSSIAHTGYLLMGLTALTLQPGNEAVPALLYYLFIYVFSSLGIFTALTWLSSQNEELVEISDLSGLAKAYPLTAFGLALLFFSFIGVPPLGGFFAKYYLFLTTLQAHQTFLVGVAVLASILSIVYYLRIVMVMYMEPTAEHWQVPRIRPITLGAVLGCCSFAVLWAGFAPVNFLNVFPGLMPLLEWLQHTSLI